MSNRTVPVDNLGPWKKKNLKKAVPFSDMLCDIGTV